MKRFKPADAARLALASYKPHKYADINSQLVPGSLNKDHVQAHLMKDGTLLIPGSNSIFDYLLYNLRLFRVGAKRYKVKDTDKESGASGTIWHQGFLAHARIIHEWVENHPHLNGNPPSYIIGHSLGAASAQILSMSFNVPAIGFASPRPRGNDEPVPNDDKCFNIVRSDDVVCQVPQNFLHLGQAPKVFPSKKRLGRHHMTKYIWLLENHKGPSPLPPQWPL